MKHILVVDDNLTALKQLEAQLALRYGVSLAKSGRLALQIGRSEVPDLILVDTEMPDMDGFAAIAALKNDPLLQHIPVIFLSEDYDPAMEVRALEAGAVDFIPKTTHTDILLHRIELHLQLFAYQHHLEHTIKELEDNIVLSFMELVGCKGDTVDNHLPATGDYVRLIGQELLKRGTFGTALTEEEVELIGRAAPFHDIGKIGISDLILMKPGPLSPEEYEEVKKHTIIGGQVLGFIYERNPEQLYFKYAQLMALGHHERFDGSGYPSGLAGEDIPLCSRMMAAANVYSACITDRIYRPAYSHAEAVGIIIAGKGTEFDPRIVEVFENAGGAFRFLPNNSLSESAKSKRMLYV